MKIEDQFATDWNIKTLPTEMFFRLIGAKKRFLEDLHVGRSNFKLKGKYITRLSCFYTTVQVKFDEYLEAEKDLELSSEDYESLQYEEAQEIEDKKLLKMEKILTVWCYKLGPFKTFEYSKKYDDIIEELDDENIEG